MIEANPFSSSPYMVWFVVGGSLGIEGPTSHPCLYLFGDCVNYLG